MTDAELLKEYRERVMALRELQEQICRCGRSGAPRGLSSRRMDGLPRGTNDPEAAAAQLMDGLEGMAARQKEELDKLWPRVLALTSRIDDVRLYMIVHQFYVLGMTLEEVAMSLYLSARTVARLKKEFLEGLGA